MTASVVATIRTPRGKAKPEGGLAGIPPLDLVTQLLAEMKRRTGIDPAEVDDVIIGCATQTGEQGGNLAKTAALLAGWPAEVPGATVNRFCASGLDAVNLAAAKIAAAQAEVIVAGGVESVSRVPMFADDGPLYADPRIAHEAGFVHMGVAADLVATLEGFERAELDEYGVTSHHRAATAWSEGRFARSLFAPVDAQGTTPLMTDEHVRPGATVEQAAAMAPAFSELGAQGQDALALRRFPQLTKVRHVHHRANSPSLADGAGVVLLASEAACRRLGLVPRAVVRAAATHSVDPVIMLTAGQVAVQKAVSAAGVRLDEIDLVEFAEAFAALCRKFQRDLGFGHDRFNVNGGTIAMGHAFGATGAILVATLLDELERRGGRYGVVGISGAAGLGVATVFERVAA